MWLSFRESFATTVSRSTIGGGQPLSLKRRALTSVLSEFSTIHFATVPRMTRSCLAAFSPTVSIVEPTIRVIAAVVRKDAQYLVCRRPRHKRHGGLWEFPGGKIETGESSLGAARRELREELGVNVRAVASPMFSVVDPGSPFVIEFTPTEIVGTPTCLEHEEIQWSPLEDLLALTLAPSDRRFAEFLMSETLADRRSG
jgi:mutator protein MutT